MAYQYRFCPSCSAQRAAFDHRCLVCGGPVRRSGHSLAVATPTDPGPVHPFNRGWHKLDAEDAAEAGRRVSAA